MSHKNCDAIIFGCMDWRLHVNGTKKQIENACGVGNADAVTLAGGAKVILDPEKSKEVFDHISLSKRLHNINSVILTVHSDCGAYGETGTEERLKRDLEEGKQKTKEKFPELEVHTVVVHLEPNEEGWKTSVEKI